MASGGLGLAELQHEDTLAVLGGTPTFPAERPVPLIFPAGCGRAGEDGAVEAIVGNEPSPVSLRLPSRQRYVCKTGGPPGASHRSHLERRLKEVMGPAAEEEGRAVICLSTGTHALRAALRAVVEEAEGPCGEGGRTEVIIPATTVASTAEAVMMEGFVPVLTDVDERTWMLSPSACRRNMSSRTAAIVAVDWLGSHCDLGPLRALADVHGARLIVDSAQSFGVWRAENAADASIYSTGYPKVLQTGGGGGVLVCAPRLAEGLAREATGILRHELMHELSAVQGLRALDRFPAALDARRQVAAVYLERLGEVPGLEFQHIPPGQGANFYQLSVLVRAARFGLDAAALGAALLAENVCCSAERMPCLGSVARLRARCRTSGALPVSLMLSQNSLTLPISSQLPLRWCERICALIKAIHAHAPAIRAKTAGAAEAAEAAAELRPGPAAGLDEPREIVDIASKFPRHWIVRIPASDPDFRTRSTSGSVPLTVLVPRDYLSAHAISTDELARRVADGGDLGDLRRGDVVAGGVADGGGLVVAAVIGRTVFLAESRAESGQRLVESGSSAQVSLHIERDNAVVVRKSCTDDGIDGNGRPWLRKQRRFFQDSVAVRETALFVRPRAPPSEDPAAGRDSIVFPYVPSHSLGEMALAGLGHAPLLAALLRLLGEMATGVWEQGRVEAPAGFLQQAHFARMQRRVAIARALVPQLDEVAAAPTVTLNGRSLLGLGPVLERLGAHPALARAAPLFLSEIHGDCNLHNILCPLDPAAERGAVLIDPRGVPLLQRAEGGGGRFERGDYAYDLSKLAFSLSGFSAIRRGLFRFEARADGSYGLSLTAHPGAETMAGAARGFLDAVQADAALSGWIERREPLASMRLRVRLGEAAHFVADAACALGRQKEEEVLPLFLTGLEKLNDVLAEVDGEAPPPRPPPETPPAGESANYGMAVIQRGLAAVLSAPGTGPGPGPDTGPDPGTTWDVMEVLIKSESTPAARLLLQDLAGHYMPPETPVHVSTEPAAPTAIRFPCVLIHPCRGVRGQTSAVCSGLRRTSEFLRDHGLPPERIDRLRVLTLLSADAPTRSPLSARQNDRLCAPGSWGVSPLILAVLQAAQLPFPRPGRWLLENDSFFVLSRDLRLAGSHLALLTTAEGSSSRRPAPASGGIGLESARGLHAPTPTFLTGVREIHPGEQTPPPRHAGPVFLPHHLGHFLAAHESHYTRRTSSLLLDLVLPRFMLRRDWIQLCHAQGVGVDADLAYDTARQLHLRSPNVELASGGDEMLLRRFDSDAAYAELLDDAHRDPLLNSLLYLPSMIKWRLRHLPQTPP